MTVAQLKIEPLQIPDVLLIESPVHRDHRGTFREFWNQSRLEAAGGSWSFVQDNIAISNRAVLRGLHFQVTRPQAKLVTVVAGEVFDVAVDVRKHSPTFGKYVAMHLNAVDGRALFIPAGFAHGYQVTSETAVVIYKCSDYYDPAGDRSLAWNDPQIGIDWPLPNPILSDKDRAAPALSTYA